MGPIEKRQIKDIYTIGGSLGLVDRNNHDDRLHQLVAGLTGKDSIRMLTADEGNQVLAELMDRMRLDGGAARKRRTDETAAGGMTEGQRRMVWRLMYRLAELDDPPAPAARLGERLCGIIRKEFNVDAHAGRPMAWLSHRQGGELIETVKRYVASAERRRMRGKSG